MDYDFSDFSFGPGTEASPLDMALIPPGEVKAQERRRIASLGDLSSFIRVSSETLVHKSDRDLWSIRSDADGSLVIERQFDETGAPLRG